ncbi:MAG: hypothetical protein ACFFAN_02905 [Promethearchaeota archaeon]
MQDIKKWFDKARVPLKIERNPININSFSVNNQDIFQMTVAIGGKKRKKEYFRIFPGHEENDIRVIDTDSKLQQVILLVHEPSREYTIRMWDPEKRERVYKKQRAPNYLRKYLMGMDESHLFIAELPNNLGPINKIKDAHKSLKPDLIVKRGKDNNRIKRQGEWFFIPATPSELEKINENINLIEKKKPLGTNSWRSRNSHIADQIIKIKDEQYVKGKVSHIEHKTLKLHEWFKVVRNNEARTSVVLGNTIYNGVKWID